MTALKASVIEGRVVAPFPEHYSQALRDLVSQLMSKDPARRPSAQYVAITLASVPPSASAGFCF
jgi:hypothetical protein